MQLCPNPFVIYILSSPSLFSHAALKKQSILPYLPVSLQPTFSDFHFHYFFETVLPRGIMPFAKSSGHFIIIHLIPVLQLTLDYSFLRQPHSSPGYLLLPFKLQFLILFHMVCPPTQTFCLFVFLRIPILIIAFSLYSLPEQTHLHPKLQLFASW